MGFNGLDCNGATAGQFKIYFINNTVFNVAMAGITFESGCSGSTVINNIVDQNALLTQHGRRIWLDPGFNRSSFIYFVPRLSHPGCALDE